jgi:hypothetical protein
MEFAMVLLTIGEREPRHMIPATWMIEFDLLSASADITVVGALWA